MATNRALNVMRASAAIVVCVGHVRGYVLKPLEGNDFGHVTAGLYALTSLGHGAVMVFFALSGYFVGGNVIRSRRRGAFSWTPYLTSRLLRLWLVLLPALVLTALVDRIGRAAYPESDRYDAASRAITHSGGLDFIGNALFLQTRIVPVYGSNGPLWSLGYEMSYYLLFPLILVGMLGIRRRWTGRVLAMSLVLAIAVIVGPLVIALFATWLAGAAIASKELQLRAWVQAQSPRALNAARFIVLVALVGAMAADKSQGGGVERITVGTYGSGACAAILIVLFLTDVHPSRRWAQSALASSRHLAESSYSLYAYHLPVLTLLATVLTPRGPTGSFAPTPAGWALVIAITAGLVAGGWLFARGTEHFYQPLKSSALERLPAEGHPRLRSGNAAHARATSSWHALFR